MSGNYKMEIAHDKKSPQHHEQSWEPSLLAGGSAGPEINYLLDQDQDVKDSEVRHNSKSLGSGLSTDIEVVWDTNNVLSLIGPGRTGIQEQVPLRSRRYRRHAASVPMNKTNDQNDHEDDNIAELEKDVFSIIFVSPVTSAAFMFSIFVVAVQLTILSLCLNGLFSGNPSRNPLNVPIYNGFSESLAQFLALLVSFFVSGDIVNFLDIFDVKYGQSEDSNYRLPKEATKFKWYLAHLLRFVVGVLGLVVAFFFILQGTEELDLFLNFAVVQFVSDLDDIAFELADRGVMAVRIQDATECVKEVRMDYKKKVKRDSARGVRRRRPWKVIIYILLFATLFTSWLAFKFYQADGFYFDTECQSYQIWFEYNIYDFFGSVCPELAKLGDGKECPDGWLEPHYRGTEVNYQAFNDIYYAERDENGHLFLDKNNRPVYYQRYADGRDFGLVSGQANETDPNPPGKISYCKNMEAWVFTIKGVRKGLGADDCSWLIKSPKTKAFLLSDVPEEDWTAWTGTITETKVDITCIECQGAEASGTQKSQDCNFHGECDSVQETCVCTDNWLGFRCEACTACDVLDSTGFLDALVKVEDTSNNIAANTISDFKLLRYDETIESPGIEVYDRPVYYFQSNQNFICLVYSGSKYTIRVIRKSKEDSIEYLKSYHSMWDIDQDFSKTLFETDITSETIPIGLDYHFVNKTEASSFTFECKDAAQLDYCKFLGSVQAVYGE